MRVLSNPFPSKPSIVFSPQKPFYSQPNYASWWLVARGAYFEEFSLSSLDVNKKKGVTETAPLRCQGPYVWTQICTVHCPSSYDKSQSSYLSRDVHRSRSMRIRTYSGDDSGELFKGFESSGAEKKKERKKKQRKQWSHSDTIFQINYSTDENHSSEKVHGWTDTIKLIINWLATFWNGVLKCASLIIHEAKWQRKITSVTGFGIVIQHLQY